MTHKLIGKRSNALLALCLVALAFATPGNTARAQTLPVTGGLTLWLDASDPDNDANPANDPADSASLATWKDKSGAGNDLLQATAGNQPLYRLNRVNGLPAVNFDGVDDYLKPNPTSILAREIFAVCNSTGNPGGVSGLLSSETDTYNIRRGADKWLGNNGTNSGDFSNGGSFWVNGGKWDILPASYHMIDALAAANATYTNFTLGAPRVTAGHGSFGRWWQGDIVEVLIYNRPLSASERASVNGYLKTKYGLALASPVQAGAPAGVNDGLMLYLDASNPDGDGVPGNNPAAGSAFSIWRDISGNEREMWQSAAGNQPTYQTAIAGLNNSAAVRFDGTSDNLITASILNMNAHEILAVVNSTGNPGGLSGLLSNGSDGLNIRHNSATAYRGNAGSNSGDFVYGGGFERLNGRKWDTIPGTNYHIINVAAPYLKTYGTFQISTVSNSRYWQGDVAEIIVYNRLLTRRERNAIGYYLKAKYGLPAAYTAALPPVENDLQLHVAADAIADGAADTNFSNSAFPQWQDLSVFERNWTFASAAGAQIKYNVLNGLPVVRFTEGSSPNFTWGEVSDIRTVFWVLNEAPGTTGLHFMLGHSSGTAPEDYVFHRGAAAGAMWGGNTRDSIRGGETRVNGARVDGEATAVPQTHSIVSLLAPESRNLRANQTQDRASANRYWNGDIAEILIYNRALTPCEVGEVGRYLRSKWGIAAPGFDEPALFKDDCPVVRGMMMHLDGQDVNGDGSAATGEPADGTAVGAWVDKSGNGASATATGAARATYIASIGGLMGARPAMRFDGVNQWFQFPYLGGIRSVFWVIKEDGDVNIQPRPLLGTVPDRGGVFAYEFHRGVGSRAFFLNGTASGYVTGGALRVNGDVKNGATDNVPVDHAIVSLIATGAVGASALCNDRGIANRTWDGDICEVLVYDRPLTWAEQQQVGQYLSQKWGIPTTYGAPASSSETPLLAGLKLNLDSADVDADGDPSNNPADGSGLALWKDKSGSGNDVAQATASSQPLVRTNRLNGLPGVNFSGNFQYLQRSPASILARDIFAVALSSGNPGNMSGLLSNETDGHNIRRQGANSYYSANVLVTGSGNDFSGQGGLFKINGMLNETVPGAYHIINASAVFNKTYANFLVGAPRTTPGHGSFGRWWQGDIMEVLIYDTPLNDAERAIIENYLSAKYGLAIANDKYSGDDPAKGSYVYAVTGIGKQAGYMRRGVSAGITLDDQGFLKDDGDFILFGHNGANAANWVTADCPTTAPSRFERIWYMEMTDAGATTASGFVNLTVDFTAAGRTQAPAGTYYLMYRPGLTGTFLPLISQTTVIGARLEFRNLPIAAVASGYLTIGHAAPAAPPAPDLTDASDSGDSNTDNLTNVTLPTFAGLAEIGTTVTLYSDVNGALGTGLAPGGAYTITATTPLSEGVHHITARAANEGGEGLDGTSLTIVVDLTPTAPPTNLALDAADDTGLFNNDRITTQNSNLTILGQAAAGEPVSIYEDTTLLASGVTDPGGNFAIDVNLGEGVHTLGVTQFDPAANESTTAPLMIVVDNTPPAPPTNLALDAADDTGLSNSDRITNLTSGLTILGDSETTALARVYDESSALLGSGLSVNGAFGADVSLGAGARTVGVAQTDAAGNEGLAAYLSITVDTAPPTFDPMVDVDPTSGQVVAWITVTTITFNEAVSGVTADKLTITTDGVTIFTATAADPAGLNTFAFAIDDVFGTGPVAIVFNLQATSGASTLTDVAGNPVVAPQWSIIKNANLVPVFISAAQTPEDAYTSVPAIVFTVQFNEAVTGFDPSIEPADLILENCVFTTGSFTGSGADYAFSVTPLAVGQVKVQIAGNAGNAANPPTSRINASSNLYTFKFDNVPPAFENLVSAPDRVQEGTTVTLTFTAGEALAADPEVTVNGHAAAYLSNAGQTYHYSYIIQPSDAEGPATVSMQAPDLAWNLGTTTDALALYVDRTAPTVTIDPVAPDPLPQVAVIRFSEGVTGMDQGDLALTWNGAPIAFSAFTIVSPSQYTVVVPNAQPGAYVLTLTAAGSGIHDLAGIALTQDATSAWAVAVRGSAVTLWRRY